MDYLESVRVGIDGLRSHKMRSFLTMLGIIFGVAAVISMLSIGEGARREALEQIAQMGMRNILIQTIPSEDIEEGSDRTNQATGLRFADVLALEKVNPLIEAVVPQRLIAAEAQYGSERLDVMVTATMPDFVRLMNYRAMQGSFFNYLDELEKRRVCVLGASIKRDLFYFKNPLGEKIKIDRDWFTVIGVMEYKLAGRSVAGYDLNKQIYIPYFTAQQRFPRETFEAEIDRIVASVSEVDRIREAANIVNATLNRLHREVQDYQISIPVELLRQRQKTQRIFNVVMGAIASISLLVGGIGIMNIMLASVMERTREIGIRRAIGATRRDILSQFLFESASLSILGGIIGILLGWGMTGLITFYAGWKTVVSVFAVLLAFGVSAAVGIIFGLYPARKAAFLDPIESLRYE
ncbi:MAG: ABC transporter permease [candidate division KSB1 bacterium]|nr:ABC transporter permease [candidate division KSB1 bacterium]MDQ7063738.1 ABC transporter permease [candidate division KSB1 bacterium]